MVEGRVTGSIEGGLALLVGVREGDDQETVNFCADKCAKSARFF